METEETVNEDTCVRCGGHDVTGRVEPDTYVYGQGGGRVELQVNVPVYKCNACQFEFLGTAAEKIYHEAVCRHLGVMTPAEIRDIRGKYEMSRAAFSELTRVGEATLARWERGSLVQNAGYDQYLYLLMFSDNVDRLRNRIGNGPAEMVDRPFNWEDRLLDKKIMNRKERFVLTRKAA